MSLEELKAGFEEGGRRARRKFRRKAKAVPGGVEPVVQAYMQANTKFAALEAARPNKAYALNHPSGPNTAVAAGTSFDCEVKFENDAYVVDILATLQNGEDFMVSSLKFASLETIAKGPVNLEAFRSTMNREHRPTPLQGRRFRAGQTVTATIVCVTDSATPVKFRGLVVHVIEEACVKDTLGTRVAPNVLSYGRMHRILGNATNVSRGRRRELR